MANIFEQTIVPQVPFSNFDLSETQIISHNFGQLIPVYIREVLPNDVFDMSCYSETEFAPMVAPMKQDCHLSVHFFYVPNRIIFDNWETFITGSEDGHALTTEVELARMPIMPHFNGSELADMLGAASLSSLQGTIFDYLGLPNELSDLEDDWSDFWISDLTLRSYFKIWYDYYRDENLQAEFTVGGSTYTYYDFWRGWKSVSDLDDSSYSYDNEGYVALNGLMPFYRSNKKDYFMGALPSPQKGEAVTLNLGSTAPVTIPLQTVRIGEPSPAGLGGIGLQLSDDLTHDTPFNVFGTTNMTGDGAILNIGDGENNVQVEEIFGTLMNQTSKAVQGVADLSKASAITVEALREAFAVQEILESLSLRGSRYSEFLRGNFGVTPDDYKLQRPQFLGGLVTPVAVQHILQTSGYSGEDSRDMTGYAAGRAFAAAGSHVFRQRFKEHGFIIGIASCMPKQYYFQGVPRYLRRQDRFDYYMVQTAHLGEQAILNSEIYLDGSHREDNDLVFGFIPRWAEYKTSLNGIHGDFRGSLNYYHMGRIFNDTPTLSEEFISTRNVQTRPFAVWKSENPNINHLLWSSFFFKVTASRPVPYHSIPKVQ